jgi:hypothetical protein
LQLTTAQNDQSNFKEAAEVLPALNPAAPRNDPTHPSELGSNFGSGSAGRRIHAGRDYGPPGDQGRITISKSRVEGALVCQVEICCST